MSEKRAYEVEQIDKNSWMIVDDIVRLFLFAGTEKALLVDSGLGSGDLKETISKLTKLPVMLVNTHADYDHISGNAQFDKVFMHPAEFARYKTELVDWNVSVGESHEVEPLWEGDVIDIGGRSFEVVLIPGHTPGSIALLDRENRILLGGDSILADRIAMVNPWRDFDAYIFSIKKLIGMRGCFDFVYSPHGDYLLSVDFLDMLLVAAISCRNGELEGVETDFIKDAIMYDAGVVKFLF